MTGRSLITLLVVILMLIAGAALLQLNAHEYLHINLFFLPVTLACLFFRARGFLAVVLSAAAYATATAWRCEPLTLLVTGGVNVLQWTALGFVIILARDKFVATREYEMRLQKDIQLAKTIQKALVSHPFEFKRVSITAAVHQSMQIGGDFYYFRPFGQKYVVFCLGDIMGKGIAAALTMAVVMGFFHEWGKKSFSPSSIITWLNQWLLSLWGEESNWFVTLFYCIYDEETMELCYASAGHHSALVLKPGGEITKLSTDGFPAGIFEESTWEEKKTLLAKGDRVILFTDGVTEARDSSGEIFSYERLFDVLTANRFRSSEELVARIVDAVREFSGEGSERDDMALLVMEVREGGL